MASTQHPSATASTPRRSRTLDLVGRPRSRRFQLRMSDRLLEAPHDPLEGPGFYRAHKAHASVALDAREPKVLLGGPGPHPVEFLLQLRSAACLTTSIVYVAATRDWLTSVDSGADRQPRRRVGVRLDPEPARRRRLPRNSDAAPEGSEQVVDGPASASAVIVADGVPMAISIESTLRQASRMSFAARRQRGPRPPVSSPKQLSEPLFTTTPVARARQEAPHSSNGRRSRPPGTSRRRSPSRSAARRLLRARSRRRIESPGAGRRVRRDQREHGPDGVGRRRRRARSRSPPDRTAAGTPSPHRSRRSHATVSCSPRRSASPDRTSPARRRSPPAPPRVGGSTVTSSSARCRRPRPRSTWP